MSKLSQHFYKIMRLILWAYNICHKMQENKERVFRYNPASRINVMPGEFTFKNFPVL